MDPHSYVPGNTSQFPPWDLSTEANNGSDVACDRENTGWSVTGQVLLCVTMVIMIVISMLGNVIVCLIVYQKAEMRSAINLLLANMAFSDILLALTCMPFVFVTFIAQRWVFGYGMCRFVSFLQSLFVCEAVSVLFIISLDRYLIVVCHRDRLTPPKARVLIAVSWTFSFVLSLPPAVGWGHYEYYPVWPQCLLRESSTEADLLYLLFSKGLMFFLPMLIMAFSFICILNTVRHNRNRVHVQHNSDTLTANQISRLGLATVNRMSIDMSFKTRAFKTILILFILYLTCWAPYSISVTYWNLSGSLEANYVAGSIFMLLGYFNSACNPMIYCWRINKFREACREIIPKSLQLLPELPERTKRRINPGAAYECHASPV